MKWMEIISVRTSGQYEEQAQQFLEGLDHINQEGSETDIQWCKNADLPGDLSVILSWTSRPNHHKSDFGLRLAEALKRFGLVDHTCWLIMEKQ